MISRGVCTAWRLTAMLIVLLYSITIILSPLEFKTKSIKFAWQSCVFGKDRRGFSKG